MILNPDVIIEVRFKMTDEGGRKTPIIGNVYSCPLFVDGKGFDCRIFIGDKKIELGKYYILPVKFLNRNFVISMLSPGKAFTLWEGKDVANGKVLEVLPASDEGTAER